MDMVHAARVLMGDSLGFHIIFVMFSLTLPLLAIWFEYLGIRKKDKRFTNLAFFFSKIMTLLVVVGVLSGTVIALQMSLVWPGIMKFGGEVIGLPFMFETYAFLIEAVFLGLYMATWKISQVPRYVHLFFGFMVFVGSTLSAYAITSINGWMNLPTGFTIVDGKFQDIDVAAAMFSTPALVTFFHSMPGYYLASGLLIAGLFALHLVLVGKKGSAAKREFNLLIIKKLMIFVSIAFVFSAITADLTGKYLAQYEPEKLAALELNYETRTSAPLLIGGIADGKGGVTGPYFEIPNALSLLACNTPNCTVKGMDVVPKDKQPSTVIHTFFDIKMTLITILVVVLLAFYIALWKKPELLKHKRALIILAAVSWFGIVIVELGWMMTEIGRQPWAIRGYLTTEQALTKTNDVSSFGYIFPVAYVVMFIVTVIALRVIIKHEKNSKEGVIA